MTTTPKAPTAIPAFAPVVRPLFGLGADAAVVSSEVGEEDDPGLDAAVTVAIGGVELGSAAAPRARTEGFPLGRFSDGLKFTSFTISAGVGASEGRFVVWPGRINALLVHPQDPPKSVKQRKK